jgi:hypothetical protein
MLRQIIGIGATTHFEKDEDGVLRPPRPPRCPPIASDSNKEKTFVEASAAHTFQGSSRQSVPSPEKKTPSLSSSKFTFVLDEEILAEALEVERQKEAEQQKLAAEKARVIAEEEARLNTEEAARQNKAKAEADASAAVEAQRLAKERALEEANQRAEAEKVAKERAAEAARLAKQQAEIEAQNKADAELAEREAAKQQALAAMLAKDARSKEAKKISPPLCGAPPTLPVSTQSKDVNVKATPAARPSPWGGKTLKPAAQAKPAPAKLPNAAAFKAAPASVHAAEAPPPPSKQPGLLGAAFKKRTDGLA